MKHPTIHRIARDNKELSSQMFFILFFLFFYDSHTHRERGKDIGRGRSRLHEPGARRGIRSWVSRIAPWAKGRRQTAAPPRDPSFFFFNFIYLFMRDTERERGRDTGRGRSRLHAPGARRGIRSRVFRITPWAKGRRQTAAPPRDPYYSDLYARENDNLSEK